MKYPFTVKVCNEAGDELVIPACAVDAMKIDDEQGAPSSTDRVIIHKGENTEPQIVTEGSVFIMNEAGNTVARYRLYPRPPQPVVSPLSPSKEKPGAWPG